MRSFDVLIIGSGHAGAQAAISLRLNGYAGSIGMIGREGVAPYERPPLSKEYLAGDKPFERMLIRPEAFWDSKAIALELDAEVTAVDPDAHTVAVASGDLIGYDVLVWAAGGDARRLSCPGSGLAGIHAVRHRADADRLRDELAGGARRAVVIGGGYIGLEAAAVLRKRGCQVVLIEAEDRVLNRVGGAELSRFYEEEHRRHGVDMRLNASVVEIEGAGGHLGAVRLGSGEVIACDVLIVGIGIVPAVGPLHAAGAAGTNGVLVDEFCRTGLPDIYAIGDCAAHANVYAEGAVVRLESVQNANDMAITAAKAICGDPQPYRAVPWFWSNQYDLRLQTVGLSLGHDEAVVRGAPETRSFSVVYLRRGRVVALDCVNATKDYVQGRRLVEAGAQIPATMLRDPARSFKEFAI